MTRLMQAVSSTVRGTLVAAPGKKLVAADLANIEGRFLAWLAGEAGLHLRETPLSRDQRVQAREDGWLRISATVVDSARLDWWLRGFGAAVRDVRKILMKIEGA